MRRLIYLTAARDDLTGILRYIAAESGSVAVATAFVADIRAHCRKLAHLPGTLGQARPELRPDIRSTPHRGYVVFFRYHGELIEIVNVIERHRDVARVFGEG